MENNFNEDDVINRMSRYQFSIIHLQDEAVGFVDRAFATLYDDDLQRQWTLRDEEGNRHVVTYNKNLQKPMLIGGWTELGHIYELHDFHTIYFGYMGDSCFHITVFPSKCKPLSIGRFLKRIEADQPLFNGPKLHFFIFLNPNQCNASHLDLPTDFDNYLRQGRFKYIFLYGPRKTVKCKLLLRNHPKKSSKIGSGWKEFCTAHGFHQTIDLVFEVDHMKSNQNVKVLTYCNF
ncbi:hypothetical protein DEO72_LG7g1316 [Vigna unguiculata]|uniref:TF-B3 domain-containing protein n=1 Tax=Vigna unguiculata TaxID=3917 RepID=A0A4D6MF18_VIGUN|nr:hypothetical protein DEO72_LG7g1316 [Vigna unguiculata]